MIKTTLKNGIELVYIPVKSFYSSVAIGVRSGYSYDPESDVGVTHLYEHIFTAMLSRLFDYGNKIEKSGFSQNASTYNGAMIVYFEHYGTEVLKILKLFKKNIENFMVGAKDFDIEKESVKNEISDWNKDYETAFSTYLKKVGFKQTRNKRFETQKSINKLKVFHLLREHDNIFSYGNVVVVLYGKIPKKEYMKIRTLLESIELKKRHETKRFYLGNHNTLHKRNDTGVLLFHVENPTFNDFLCEQIYKNTMVEYDDSILYNLLRNKERLSYGASYDDIDGVGERIFYFYFTFKDKLALKKIMRNFKSHQKIFKHDKKLFEKGKRRTLIEFYKNSLDQSDFVVDLAYYYLLYGEVLDINKIRKRLSSIKYDDYDKWIRKLTYKRLIV